MLIISAKGSPTVRLSYSRHAVVTDICFYYLSDKFIMKITIENYHKNFEESIEIARLMTPSYGSLSTLLQHQK